MESDIVMDKDQAMTSAKAWQAEVAYHEGRAAQEKQLADDAQTDAARTAHLLLSDRHRALAVSAEHVAGMTDAELPSSSRVYDTGAIMRESYGDLD